MATNEIMAKSSGIIFTGTVKDKDTGAPINLTSATVKEFRLKPAHTKGVAKKATASYVTNGSDGKLKFTTTTSTFDVVGSWYVQIYLVMTGYAGYTTKITIEVLDILEVA